MKMLGSTSEALYGPALLSAILAAVGFLAKIVFDWLKSIRESYSERKRNLQYLEALLEATKGVFAIQKSLRGRLHDSLFSRFPEECEKIKGYEETFSELFLHFNEEEKKLHGLIRSITMNAMRSGNKELLGWLKNDRYFKTKLNSFGDQKKLAIKLRQLELHLSLWEAKYKYWIPDFPEHALVYLNDEEHHGVAFPYGIESIVEKMLGKLSTPRENMSLSENTKTT